VHFMREPGAPDDTVRAFTCDDVEKTEST
jgi:hypothetical protein